MRVPRRALATEALQREEEEGGAKVLFHTVAMRMASEPQPCPGPEGWDGGEDGVKSSQPITTVA